MTGGTTPGPAAGAGPQGPDPGTSSNPGAETILILQGGGALGAYECGAYSVLSDRLEGLSIVAGASVGAINAGLIARNYRQPDRGVQALEEFWRSLAFPAWSWPAVPFLEYAASAQAALATVFFGNPRLFSPSIPWPGMTLAGWAPYTTRPMRNTVAKAMGTYRKGGRPRLIVAAVEVEGGRQVTFDSNTEDITPAHIVASCSLPPGFPPTQIDGRHYWDGALWGDTPLLDVAVDLANPSPSGCHVYVVDGSARPSAGPETPPPRVPSEPERRPPVTVTRIQRLALPLDQISVGIDFSAGRIEKLIAEGHNDALEALANPTGRS